MKDDHEVEDSEEYKSDTEEVDDFPEISSSNLSSQLSHLTESKEGLYVFFENHSPHLLFLWNHSPPLHTSILDYIIAYSANHMGK